MGKNAPGSRVPPTLRAMFWRVANGARKRARSKESRAGPVPVLDLGSASLRIGSEGALFTFELVFMLVYALCGVFMVVRLKLIESARPFWGG